MILLILRCFQSHIFWFNSIPTKYSIIIIIIIVTIRSRSSSVHNSSNMRILAEDKADSADFDKNHKFSFEINGSVESSSSSSSSSTLSPFSPLLLIETLSRKSFSYGKLPLIPIKLTVLKLDGSSFGKLVLWFPICFNLIYVIVME